MSKSLKRALLAGGLAVLALALASCGAKQPTTSYTLEITESHDHESGLISYGINGDTKGETIEAQFGDMLEIKVVNQTSKAMTIHWHGVKLPNSQDGVADVTQPAIEGNGGTFTYRYPVAQTGTYWYHAHSFEEAQGVLGGMIFRDKNMPQQKGEELLIFSGDLGGNPMEVYTELSGRPATMNHGAMSMEMPMEMNHEDMTTPEPTHAHGNADESLMIKNSHSSMMHYSDVTYEKHTINGSPDSPVLLGGENGKIKLRLVNAYPDGFLNLVYSGGDITVVAKDGLLVEPFEAPNLRMSMGETFDILLDTKDGEQNELVSFFMDGDGFSRALIGEGRLNSLPYFNRNNYPTAEVYEKIKTLPADFLPKISEQDLVNAKVYEMKLVGDHDAYNWAIESMGKQLTALDVKAGDTLIFEIKNDTMMPHPMHLHGEFFQVVSLENQPFMHTMNVNPNETVRIAIKIDEKGDWLFHCHNLFHMVAGMTIMLNVN